MVITDGQPWSPTSGHWIWVLQYMQGKENMKYKGELLERGCGDKRRHCVHTSSNAKPFECFHVLHCITLHTVETIPHSLHQFQPAAQITGSYSLLIRCKHPSYTKRKQCSETERTEKGDQLQDVYTWILHTYRCIIAYLHFHIDVFAHLHTWTYTHTQAQMDKKAENKDDYGTHISGSCSLSLLAFKMMIVFRKSIIILTVEGETPSSYEIWKNCYQFYELTLKQTNFIHRIQHIILLHWKLSEESVIVWEFIIKSHA